MPNRGLLLRTMPLCLLRDPKDSIPPRLGTWFEEMCTTQAELKHIDLHRDTLNLFFGRDFVLWWPDELRIVHRIGRLPNYWTQQKIACSLARRDIQLWEGLDGADRSWRCQEGQNLHMLDRFMPLGQIAWLSLASRLERKEYAFIYVF